jgi:hypothetical protein
MCADVDVEPGLAVDGRIFEAGRKAVEGSADARHGLNMKCTSSASDGTFSTRADVTYVESSTAQSRVVVAAPELDEGPSLRPPIRTSPLHNLQDLASRRLEACAHQPIHPIISFIPPIRPRVSSHTFREGP